MNKLVAWHDAISIYFIQASAADNLTTGASFGQAHMRALKEEIELKVLESELLQRLNDLYLKVLLLEFTGPADVFYIAEREKVLDVIQSVIAKMDQFLTVLNGLDVQLANVTLVPVLTVQPVSLSSDTTAEGNITLSPEVFTFKAHIKNISSASIANLGAKLNIDSPRDSISLISSQEQAVSTGTLTADDEVDGAGSDEADVVWQFQYSGELKDELIMLSVELLEGGVKPGTFVFNETSKFLIVHPSQSDADSDFMPDDWEADHGLDPTVDDSGENNDHDGLLNWQEYRFGTDPQNADSDDDTLDDGEEVIGGADGYVTDPLDKDTDDDGVDDATDGQPVDGGTTDSQPVLEEPEVAVDRLVVILNNDNPVTQVRIKNGGTGELTWTAETDDDAIAMVYPNASVPEFELNDGFLTISSPTNSHDFASTTGAQTTIKVMDVFGNTRDKKIITVCHVSCSSPLEYELSVIKDGEGSGSVNSALPGINCGEECTATYGVGSTVTLGANPAAASTFAGWSGGGCAGTGSCVVDIIEQVQIKATFTSGRIFENGFEEPEQ